MKAKIGTFNQLLLPHQPTLATYHFLLVWICTTLHSNAEGTDNHCSLHAQTLVYCTKQSVLLTQPNRATMI